MAWPLSQDYNEAIQSPTTCLADPELKAGGPVTNALGIPQPRSGNFADVYEFLCPAAASRWALKCFTREVKGLRERYAEVSDYLRQAKLPFTVEFHYLEQGMRIRGAWYPALKMRWVEGLLLNEFVRDNLDKPARLQALSQIWLRMAKRLREAGLAHADLQHGNVILVPGSTANSLAVKLIDYDGMFVPALAGKKSGEVGHPNYQHPQRLKEGTYSAEVDRFPLLVVATALRVLAAPGGKALWQRYDNGDNLLFKETDLRAPSESALFKELRQASDPLTKKLVGALEKGCAGRLQDVPLLEELLPEEKPATKTAIKGPGGVAKTAGAAAESPDWDFDREGPAPGRPVRRRGTSVPPWAWAAGGAVAATLVLGGILLATRKGPEKAPEVARNDPTPKVSRPKKPAPIKPVVPPLDRPPQLVPGEHEGDKPPREPGDPGPVVDVRPRPDPVVAPLPSAGGASPLDRLNPEKIPAADRLPDVKELVAVLKAFKAGAGGSVAISPNGKYLAASYPDRSLHMWDLSSNRASGTGFWKPVRRLAFTPDSKFLVFGSNGEVHFWTGPILTPRHRMPGGDYVAVSADGRMIAHAQDNDIHLVDRTGDKPLAKGLIPKAHEGRIPCLAFFPNGRGLASAGDDGAVKVWDLTRTPPACKGTIRNVPTNPITALAVAPDGKALVFGTAKDRIELRPINDLQPQFGYIKKAHEGGTTSICFAPDSRTFITTGGAGAARNQLIWWNTADGSKRAEWPLPACSAGVFAADGRHVAVTCDNGNVYILRLAPGAGEKAPPRLAGGPIRVVRHTKVVGAVCAVDKAGKQFISADGAEPRLWNADTGEEIHRFRGHTNVVVCLAVSADGRRLLTASLDETMRLWDIATGKEIQQFKHPSPVRQVAFSHDGKFAVSGSGRVDFKDAKWIPTDCCLRVWDLANGNERGRFEGLNHFPTHVLFSPEDDQVLASPPSGAILVWDVASKKVVKRFEPPTGPCVCIVPDGKHVVKSDGLSLQVWDLDTRRKLGDFPMGGARIVPPGAVSPDGRWVVTGKQEGNIVDGRVVSTGSRVRLWDVTMGREVARYREGHTLAVTCMAISPDGNRAFSGGWDKLVCVWDLKRPEGAAVAADPAGRPKPDPMADVRPKPDPVADPVTAPREGLIRVVPHPNAFISAVCAVDAAGRQFVSAENTDIYLWDADTGKEIRRFRGHFGFVTGLAVSRDGAKLLSSSHDKTVRLWDIATGRELHKFKTPSRVHQVTFSHDGKYALAGCGDFKSVDKKAVWEDCCLRIWDLDSGKALKLFEGLSQAVKYLTFTPDDRRVVASSDLAPALAWDVESEAVVKRCRRLPGICIGVLPDGKQVLTNIGSERLQLWDLEKDVKLRDFTGGGGSHAPSAAFSPDGSRCVTGGRALKMEDRRLVSTDSTVRLWDVATGQELARFKGHTREVVCVAISPDGSRAFSGSRDKTVRVWDLKRPGTAVVAADPVPPPEVKPVIKPKPEVPAPDLAPLAPRKVKFPFTFKPSSSGLASRSGVVTQSPRARMKVLTEPKWRLEVGGGWARSFAVHPNGKYFLHADGSNQLHLSDLATGRIVRDLKGRSDTYIMHLCISADGKRALSAGGDKLVYVWDLTTGEVVQRFRKHTEGITGVALSPDGKRALSWQGFADKPSGIYLWDTADGKALAVQKGSGATVIVNAQFFPDGKRVLLARGTFGSPARLTLWDPEKDRERPYFNVNQERNPDPVGGLALSGDGEKLLVSLRSSLAVLKTRTAWPLCLVKVDTMARSSADLSPNGHLVLSAGGASRNGESFDCFIHVVSAQNGVEFCRMKNDISFIRAAFTPDGKHILAATHKEIMLWELPETKGRGKP